MQADISATARAVDAPLLRAKLSRPQTRSTLVDRPELVERLNVGLSQRWTLISAPPGYGKTTIAAQWLSAQDRPVAWLSLDPLDNDLNTFLSYALAAVATAYPDAGENTVAVLRGTQTPPLVTLADALIEDLADLPGPLIMALDDFHLITSQDLTDLVDRLVQFLPTNIHLVLISRVEPTLPLAQMRARREMTEIGMADLQFTVDQAQRLLAGLTGQSVDVDLARLLGERTEGWAIGLQLAALALPEGESLQTYARRFANERHAFISDYLVDEVLARQPAHVRDFLLRTSILERLSEPLCSAVMGQRLSEPTTLEDLWRSNLLIAPQDEARSWYRYHQLFRDLLYRQLLVSMPAEDVRELHLRAFRWLAEEGFVGEAIAHATAAGDADAAVRLIQTNLHRALNHEDWRRIIRWLELLPEPARQQPAMLLAQGWLHILHNRADVLKQILIETEQRLAVAEMPRVERDSLVAQIAVMKAYVANWSGDPFQAHVLAEKGLAGLRPDMHYAVGLGHFYSSFGLHVTGHTAEALSAFQAAIDSNASGPDVLLTRLVMGQCLINLEIGDLPALKTATEALARLGSRSGLLNSIGWADYVMGLLHYEWNDLEQAEEYLRRVVAQPYNANSRSAYEAFLALILTLEAAGRPAEADEFLTRLGEFLVESNNLQALPLADAMRLRLAVNREQSLTYVSGSPPSPAQATQDLRRSFLISPLLARVRCQLVAGTTASLKDAAESLAVMRQTAESLQLQGRLVEILALEATVLDATGERERALEVLRHSIQLALRGRMIRQFVDCGPGLVPLLELLREESSGPLAKYVERILGAYAVTAAAGVTVPTTDDALVQLRASLTNREQDVLLLLAERMSNKEIAARLVVSPVTIKKHTANIYRKLCVNNRRAAVSVAERLGLLSSL